MLRFEFMNGPWENSELPTIVRDSATGGDPHILAVLKRVHNPAALHELCALANEALEAREKCPREGGCEYCREFGCPRAEGVTITVPPA